MPKKLSKRLVDGLIYCTILIIGICIGKLIQFQYFTLDKNINVVDLVSIGVTVLAAIVVTTILDKDKEDRRNEKDLILKRLEDIYQLIEASQTVLTQPNVSYQVAASQIKSIYTYLNTAVKIISNTNIGLPEDYKSIILANLRSLKNLLTSGTVVNNGNILLNQGRILEVQAEFVRLKDNVLLFQIALNRA